MDNAFDLTVNALREKGLSSDQILEELSNLFQGFASLANQYETKNSVDTKIRTMLKQLGMPINIDGYNHWVHAIQIYNSATEQLMMQDIYNLVAEKCGIAPKRVERTMRFAIERAFHNCEDEKIKETFAKCLSAKTGRPKNRQFLVILSEQI